MTAPKICWEWKKGAGSCLRGRGAVYVGKKTGRLCPLCSQLRQMGYSELGVAQENPALV